MAPVMNTRILLNEIPQQGNFTITMSIFQAELPLIGHLDPEKTFKVDRSQQFDIDKAKLNGGIAVKILSLSIDPFHVARMRMPQDGSNSVCVYMRNCASKG